MRYYVIFIIYKSNVQISVLQHETLFKEIGFSLLKPINYRIQTKGPSKNVSAAADERILRS